MIRHTQTSICRENIHVPYTQTRCHYRPVDVYRYTAGEQRFKLSKLQVKAFSGFFNLYFSIFSQTMLAGYFSSVVDVELSILDSV